MVEHEIAGLAGLHQLYLVLRATMLQHHMPALAVKLRLLERSAYATPAYATPAYATPAHATSPLTQQLNHSQLKHAATLAKRR